MSEAAKQIQKGPIFTPFHPLEKVIIVTAVALAALMAFGMVGSSLGSQSYYQQATLLGASVVGIIGLVVKHLYHPRPSSAATEEEYHNSLRYHRHHSGSFEWKQTEVERAGVSVIARDFPVCQYMINGKHLNVAARLANAKEILDKVRGEPDPIAIHKWHEEDFGYKEARRAAYDAKIAELTTNENEQILLKKTATQTSLPEITELLWKKYVGLDLHVSAIPNSADPICSTIFNICRIKGELIVEVIWLPSIGHLEARDRLYNIEAHTIINVTTGQAEYYWNVEHAVNGKEKREYTCLQSEDGHSSGETAEG